MPSKQAGNGFASSMRIDEVALENEDLRLKNTFIAFPRRFLQRLFLFTGAEGYLAFLNRDFRQEVDSAAGGWRDSEGAMRAR